MDDDIDGIPLEKLSNLKSGGFIPSKWETVDPEQVSFYFHYFRSGWGKTDYFMGVGDIIF